MRVKQVLLYRRDLKMRKGKIAAQCAHASLAVFLRRRLQVDALAAVVAGQPQPLPPERTLVLPLSAAMMRWVEQGSSKIVLSVPDEPTLLRAQELAAAAGLPHALIRDAGRTEFRGEPTLTACAIGPADAEAIDAITGPEGELPTKLA